MKKKGDPIDGVLLFDKPEGLSSNAAMQIVRRLANAQKAGHTGTLDPMATGLLPLCFGNATKYSADLLNAEKGYEARVQLGAETDSGDRHGHRHTDVRCVGCDRRHGSRGGGRIFRRN